MGVAEVVRESYPDPTDEKGVFLSVDVKTLDALPKPVTLAAVKADRKLADMALVKYGRLSVQPVTDAEWKAVCRMGGLKDYRCEKPLDWGAAMTFDRTNYLVDFCRRSGGMDFWRRVLHAPVKAVACGCRHDSGGNETATSRRGMGKFKSIAPFIFPSSRN